MRFDERMDRFVQTMRDGARVHVTFGPSGAAYTVGATLVAKKIMKAALGHDLLRADEPGLFEGSPPQTYALKPGAVWPPRKWAA
jgi:hypothetical protein